ncbi:MAG: acyltransferase [Oscillospiraceae bacterium]|nr:acyltransferase [Oscillospiraceae bacterium]
MNRSAGRDIAVDLIKTVAIISVLFIHCSSGGYSAPIKSSSWLAAVFWGSVSRAGVPLFLMCSGALMLPQERELTIKKLWCRSILRLLTALFFWAVLYKLYNGLIYKTLSSQYVLTSIKELVLFRHENHFYYLHIMLLVYAFLPATRAFIRAASERETDYFLLIWFLVGILYPTIRPYRPFSLLAGIPGQWLLNMTYASVGYGVLGYRLRRRPLKKQLAAALAIAGLAVATGGTVIGSIKTGGLYEHFLEGMTVGVCLLAAGIFSLCVHSAKGVSGRTASVYTFMSKASFCIYLVHIFALKGFYSLGVSVRAAHCVITVPALAAAVLVLSLLVYLLLSRIPWVKRWLI